MSKPGQKPLRVIANGAIVLSEANTGIPLTGDFERMARRRFQNPKPNRRGHWWYIQVRRDEFVDGKLVRKNHWEKLAPATMPEREVADGNMLCSPLTRLKPGVKPGLPDPTTTLQEPERDLI